MLVRLLGSMSSDPLLDAIYSAAFDVEGWKAVCDRISERANAVGSVLICSRPELRPFNMMRSDSIGPLMDEYVADGWYLRDARSIGVQRAGLSGSFFTHGYVLDSQLIDAERMDEEPFYVDLLKRHGLKWFCGLRIGENDDWAAFSINRRLEQDDFSPEEVNHLLSYRDHLTRAAKIAELANFTKLETALQTFEAMSFPAFAIDVTGLVLAHNAAADATLGRGLMLRGKRLVCSLSQDQIELDRLIKQLAAVSAPLELCDPVIVHDENGAALFVVRSCPLLGPPVDIFAGPKSVLFAQPLLQIARSITQLLQKGFGLSAKQAELTEHLAQGKSLKEASEQMAITHATARDHLKAVFTRVGVNRQAELVTIVSRIMR